jgi:NTP pyrophosphatase (non-canonical NTP hydrolase)
MGGLNVPEKSINQKTVDDVRWWAFYALPNTTFIGQGIKLAKETGELVGAITRAEQLEEFADIAIVFCNMLGMAQITMAELADAIDAKMEINRNRSWLKSPDGSYQHLAKLATDQLADVANREETLHLKEAQDGA